MTESHETVISKVREFLRDGVGGIDLAEDEDIFETGAVTSLFAMELVLFVESTFGITVENEDLDLSNFSSIRNLSTFVETKLG